MSHELASQKQMIATGGNTNYYLQIIQGTDGDPDVVVEIEDIIEALDMNFSIGCVFKALVRLCKLRHDLGKPGSTPIYEKQKIIYYCERTLAISKRRHKLPRRIMGIVKSLSLYRRENTIYLYDDVYIKDPKRLKPYHFNIEDFIESLEPTSYEHALLNYIFVICHLRQSQFYLSGSEVAIADDMVAFSQKLLDER